MKTRKEIIADLGFYAKVLGLEGRDGAMDALESAAAEITRLEAVNAELVEALTIFADPSNWVYGRAFPQMWSNYKIHRPSDLAKAALAHAQAPAATEGSKRC